MFRNGSNAPMGSTNYRIVGVEKLIFGVDIPRMPTSLDGFKKTSYPRRLKKESEYRYRHRYRLPVPVSEFDCI